MGMKFDIINPDGWDSPRGYANGVVAPAGGRLLFIAGQIAWDAKQQIVSDDFLAQFDQALANVIAVVTTAGGTPDHIARWWFTSPTNKVFASLKAVGQSWRERMGTHYPAMALVEVKGLLEDAAKVEIEGIAVLPEK